MTGFHEMKAFKAVEAEYTAFLAFGRADGDLGSRATSLGYVSLQAFAMFAVFAGRLPLSGIAGIFLVIYLCLFLLLDRRRARLSATYWRTDWEPSLKQRLAVVAFMSISSITIAIVARHSFISAVFAYFITATLPLQAWIDSIEKGRSGSA